MKGSYHELPATMTQDDVTRHSNPLH